MEAKVIGNVLMVGGVSAFLAGFGINCTVDLIENSKIRKKNNAKREDEKIRYEALRHDAEIERIRSEADKNDIYTSKLKNMSDKEFAKHHAEATAKANKDVLDRAQRIESEAKASVVDAQLEYNDKLYKANAECLRKVEEANKKAEEASKKYEEINKLFTNKDEILKAKRELEWVMEKAEKNNSDKDELYKKLSLILS